MVLDVDKNKELYSSIIRSIPNKELTVQTIQDYLVWYNNKTKENAL